MRENPWHLRLPTTEHHQWFKNLVDLHELTTSWLKEVQTDRPSHFLTRGLSTEVTENLWMLDSLSNTPMEKLLDDTQPQDMLGRLEQTVWAFQSWTLTQLYGKTTPSSTRNALDSMLEQASWKLGRSCVEARWRELAQTGNQDLRDILLALNDSPFSGYPKGEGFLVRRAIAKEIQIELRCCPHQVQYQEVKPVADRLCRLHSHWMRGFAYALNNRVSVEHLVQSPRCVQRWCFA
jgi:hypothetical protein